MVGAIVQVPFDGDFLEAARDGDKVLVSLRRGCENLGLNFSKQLQKLKSRPWACVSLWDTHDATGREQKMVMIDLDTVPMWLATIDPRRVKEEAREKLARYQNEAAKVLARHFLKQEPEQPLLNGERLTKLIHDMHGLLVEERAKTKAFEERLAALESRPASILPYSTPAMPRTTIQERLRFKNWLDTSARQRAQIRRMANLWLDLRYSETPDVSGGPGGPLVWFGHQIVVLDEAIDTVRETYLERDRKSKSLFAATHC